MWFSQKKNVSVQKKLQSRNLKLCLRTNQSKYSDEESLSFPRSPLCKTNIIPPSEEEFTVIVYKTKVAT